MLNKKKNFRYILIGILGGCGILISGRRNGGEKMYQIPKGNVAINETVYTFYKPFLEQYGIKIDTEAVKQMTPKEVILYLMPYFEQERFLDDQYYLTSADD